MRDVYVCGVGMTQFGKFLDRSMKDLVDDAVGGAFADVGLPVEIEAAYVGNAVGGLITGQEMIRGQVALRSRLTGIPIFNIENACASASSAFHLAWQAIRTGSYDVALAVGVEKLVHQDKQRSFDAIGAAVDVEARAELAGSMAAPERADRSFFMDIYADMSKAYMAASGATRHDFAEVVRKAHDHAALNPLAQYRNRVSVEEVLASREIAWPLTLLMCSPIGDGAAAAILLSEDAVSRLEKSGRRKVRILASVVRSGSGPSEEKAGVLAARAAYELAGLGPDDIHCAEVHDASAPAELMIYEDLGFADRGDGPRLIREGETRLGGKRPINTSGGLLCKGHPIGATGIAQVVEITRQLRGEAGERQVDEASIGMTQNGGGWLDQDSAAMVVHLFQGVNP